MPGKFTPHAVEEAPMDIFTFSSPMLPTWPAPKLVLISLSTPPMHQGIMQSILRLFLVSSFINQEINDHRRLFEHISKAELKQEILKAAKSQFLSEIDDIYYGVADISLQVMRQHLQHLQDTKLQCPICGLEPCW